MSKRERVKGWTLVFAVLSVWSIASGCRYRQAQMASTVSPASVRRISVGMTEQEVTAILGPPLGTRPGGGGVIFDYATPGLALRNPSRSLSIWISLLNGAVHTVHVEEYPLIRDHRALYEASPNSHVYEHPDFAAAVTQQQ